MLALIAKSDIVHLPALTYPPHSSSPATRCPILPLEQPIIRRGLRSTLLRIHKSLVLRLTRRLEKQTRALPLLNRICQIPPMRRIAIILDILPACRIRQPVLVFLLHGVHDGAQGLVAQLLGFGLARRGGGEGGFQRREDAGGEIGERGGGEFGGFRGFEGGED